MTMMRVLATTAIHNFRDYGGYRAADGAHVRAGVLWRSGQHADATAADLDAVAALDLATVVDLRGDGERRRWPCVRPAGFAGSIVFADGETAGGAAAHLEEASAITTAADAHAAMLRLYRSMPFRPVLVATLRLYFQALAMRDGASLVHCFAGKDRTGFAVALVHHVLGVGRGDIVADYLLTNHVGDSAARIAAGAANMRRAFGPQMSEAAIATLMSVDSAYLDAAFAALGDIDRYLEASLGVDAATRDRLRARLLR
jgi:protein-tyrosine phosphatase